MSFFRECVFPPVSNPVATLGDTLLETDILGRLYNELERESFNGRISFHGSFR